MIGLQIWMTIRAENWLLGTVTDPDRWACPTPRREAEEAPHANPYSSEYYRRIDAIQL